MKRALLAAAMLLALSQAASASANLDCAAKDSNVAKLEIEAITSRDGRYFGSLRGEVEIERGKAIELTLADLKSHQAEKNIALRFAKQTPQGLLEVRIYAKPADDSGLDYEGTYIVRLGKISKGGKISCAAG